ncbi:Nn.00g094380.m01.CDS01 [Neocucurbitaria sp. VM-36]
MIPSQPSTYKQGHHRAVTANHKIRTAEVDGAFLLPYLKSQFHVLDIGCGPGSITTGFAKYVPQGSVTGVDLTREIIEQANEHLESEDPKPNNVAFEVGNVVEGLQQFQDEKFDVVFCNQTLIHIPEPVKALTEMRRVCKTGGLVACREGDWPFRYYPELPGLQIFHKYLWLLVHGLPPADSMSLSSTSLNAASKVEEAAFLRPAPYPPNHRSGSRVHVWARQAGFDAAKITKAADAKVVASPEERQFHASVMVARIDEAGHRKKFSEIGASEEEIDEMVRGWREWDGNVDGWYGMMHCEVICWK